MVYRRPRAGVLLVCPLVVAAACGGSSSSSTTAPSTATTTPAPTSSTTFQGTLAGVGASGQSGTVTVTVATVISAASFRPLAVSTATGSVHITGGNTTAVSGTYDSSTNGVSVSGGGFSFTGTVNGGALSGSYSQNDVTGGFSALNTSAGSVTTYCGTYNSVKPFKDNFGRSGTYFENGNWNVQVSSNGVATGESIPTSSGYSGPAQGPKPPAAPNFLTGQLVGNALTLTAEGGTLTVNVNLQAGIMSGGVESTGALSVSASAAACQ